MNKLVFSALLAVASAEKLEGQLEGANTELRHHGNPLGAIIFICIALCFIGCGKACGHHGGEGEHHEALIE